MMSFFRSYFPLSIAIFVAELRQQRISITIGARAVDKLRGLASLWHSTLLLTKQQPLIKNHNRNQNQSIRNKLRNLHFLLKIKHCQKEMNQRIGIHQNPDSR